MNTVTAAPLVHAIKTITVQWQETKADWNDAKSREFEARYIQPLPNEALRAVNAIKELDVLLRKIQIDCE